MLHRWLSLSLIYAYEILPIPCCAYAHLVPGKSSRKLAVLIPFIVSPTERVVCLIKIHFILKNNAILPATEQQKDLPQPISRGIVGVPVAF